VADRVLDYGLKSLARFLKTVVSGINNAYVVSSDFDWDKRPTNAAPGNATEQRPLPFAGVVLVADDDPPFTVGNILYERNIQLNVELCCEDHTNMVQLTADMKQALRSATNAQTSDIGIVLYNFALASGSFFANAGTLQVEVGQTQYFGPELPKHQGNRKYLSITPLMLTAFKDCTATLLENMGRVGLTDD